MEVWDDLPKAAKSSTMVSSNAANVAGFQPLCFPAVLVIQAPIWESGLCPLCSSLPSLLSPGIGWMAG